MESNAPHSEHHALGASGDSAEQLYLPVLWVIYASLFAFYLILRFFWFGGRWPTPQDMQIEIPWAAIGAVVLVVSSIAIAKAERVERSSRSQVARGWLILTLILGICFAIFQANEYRRRWLHNLIPAPFSNSLHDRADLYFLSAVQQRFMQLAQLINTSKVRQNQLIEQLQNLTEEHRRGASLLEAELKRFQADELQRTERLSVINRLLISEAKWTSSVVAKTDDIAIQRMAIAALANDIHPHRAFVASHQQFRQLESQLLEESLATAKKALLAAENSAKENSEPIKHLLSAVAEAKAEQHQLESQLKSYLRQLLAKEELEEDVPEQARDPKRVALESRLAEVHQRLAERNAKLTSAAKLVTEAEDSASLLSLEVSAIDSRQSVTAEIDGRHIGLNQQFEWLRLPVCIPGGTAWAWTYFTLMILHSTHLAFVVIAVFMVAASTRRVSSDRLPKTAQIARNWHSMVIVWVILFLLMYLI